MHLPTQGFRLNSQFQMTIRTSAVGQTIFSARTIPQRPFSVKKRKTSVLEDYKDICSGADYIFLARTIPQRPFSVKKRKKLFGPSALVRLFRKKRRFPLRQLGLFQKKKVPSPFVRVVPKGRFPLRQLEFFQKEGSFSVY